jgi:hypothetical protein
MIVQNMMAPHMNQFGQMPPHLMPGLPPHMQTMPPNMYGMPPGMPLMPPRPLFPAASATSAVNAQPKPTFPAYSNATISAPPTTNTGNSSKQSTPDEPAKAPPQQTQTATKIIHPPEDLSLEEIRARHPKYHRKPTAVTTTASMNSSMSSQVSNIAASTLKSINEAKMAHEVGVRSNRRSSYVILDY